VKFFQTKSGVTLSISVSRKSKIELLLNFFVYLHELNGINLIDCEIGFFFNFVLREESQFEYMM
jgi:hypothetical protein